MIVVSDSSKIVGVLHSLKPEAPAKEIPGLTSLSLQALMTARSRKILGYRCALPRPPRMLVLGRTTRNGSNAIMTRWSFNPIFGNYAFVAVTCAVLMLLLVLGPRFQRVSRRRRWILVALRGVVILLLLAALLRPTVVRTIQKEQSARLLFLIDASRSMTLPSGMAALSRWQSQQQAFNQAMAELQDAGETIEVRAYTYDSQLRPMTVENGSWTLPNQPTGDQTDLGSSLYDAVRQELGKRLAGVVLLGDGAQTAFAPKVEIAEAGRELARLNCPLYTVAFGPAGDTAQSRDVAIENLPEQYSVFVKNELPVKGVLRVRGYANQEIPVELTLEDSTGKIRSIAAVQLTAREDDQLLPAELTYIPEQPGQYKLTLKAADQPGELVTRNNELSAFVTVLEGGLQTLYLYGSLLGEQRILRRAIDLSPDIQLDDVFVDPKNFKQWPIELSEYLDVPKFDVLLLEDTDAAALSDANQRQIALAVERGRGLMMIGGFHSFGPGGYFGKPLADVLPVTMGRLEHQDFGFDKPVIRDLHLWGELAMVPTKPHPITMLAPPDQNLDVWKSLPKLEGANRFQQPKPRAQTLAESSDGQPLLVAGEYGQGRVLAFAGNTTFRWWQRGRQSEYRRFWRQVILWLARRDETQRNDVWVQLAQRRFPVGSRVSFTAGAKSAAGDVFFGATYTAELIAPDKTRQSISLSTSGNQVAGAVDQISKPGDYLIAVNVTLNGQPAGQAQATFQVLDRDVELSNPAADYDLLARLAMQTKDAGGRPVSPEELPELLREIKKRQRQSRVEVQAKWQLADTATDSWLFLLVFVSILTSEWALRKKWGLV